MMKYKVLLYTLAIILVACNNVPKQEKKIAQEVKIEQIEIPSNIATVALSVGKDSKPSDISFVSKSYSASEEIDGDDKTTATIKVAIAQGNSAAAQLINDTIYHYVKSIMSPRESLQATTYQDMPQAFVSEYIEVQEEMEVMRTLKWFSELETVEVHNSVNLINISISYAVFTGGAHPNHFVVSLLFDPHTGKTLQINNIVSNIWKFTELAEIKFREEYEIGKDESLNSKGFWFEDDVFTLPTNIFVQDEGLELLYNSYEVSPYVMGPLSILIPYSQLGDLLKLNP